MAEKTKENAHIQSGYLIGVNGQSVCAGIICKCNNGSSIFCPMHGKVEARQREDFNKQVDESNDGLFA